MEHEVTDTVTELHLQPESETDSETETSFQIIETREVNLTKLYYIYLSSIKINLANSFYMWCNDISVDFKMCIVCLYNVYVHSTLKNTSRIYKYVTV